MNEKLFISSILLIMFIIPLSSCTFAVDKGYSIPFINQDLYLQDDGAVHVKETLHYSSELIRNYILIDVPVSGSQHMQNLKVSSSDAYTQFNVTDHGGMKRITVQLYSDPQKITPIPNKDVEEVTIEYDLLPVIMVYNDIAELQYKIVGDDEVYVGVVNTIIHLKSNDDVKYWLNPGYYAGNSSWQGNDLNITSKNLPPGESFEMRMFISLNQFTANPTNGIIINQNGADEIEKLQNYDQNQLNFRTNLNSIVAILLLVSCFIPLFIYIRCGRNPKIEYNAVYEMDTPTDDPPAVVNAISGKVFGKEVGKPDMDGFRATVMDLIYHKYLVMPDITSIPNKKGEDHYLTFKINDDKDLSELENFEMDVVNFLRYFEDSNGIICMDNIKKNLKSETMEIKYAESYNLWKSDLKQVLNKETMDKVFKRKGDTYLKIFAGVGLIVAVLTFFASVFNPLPTVNYAFFASIILGSVATISMLMPERISGRWTTYGEEYDAKWHNFAKYLRDFSMIKDDPPESLLIWNKYMVYATALGIADEVVRSMEISFPQDVLTSSDIYLMYR